MSVFNYNYYKTLKRPYVYIATPNKKIIGTIMAKELETDFMANSMSKGTFKVNRYEDNSPTPFYDWIKIGMYIQLSGVDWFIITEVHIINESYNEYKEITYLSLEHELSKKYLTSFGALGIDSDEQGGLDRYCLYNITDTSHSILHIVIQKNPDWSIKYVDSNITSEYRSFEVDSIDTYSFLTENVSEAFDCIFIFDSTDKSISAYSLDTLGKDTNITLSYKNFIKSVDQSSDDDDVKTVLTVTGGNDSRTNTPIGIIDVNISGTNQIYNFSYYLHMMSEELQLALSNYDKKCNENEDTYQKKLSELNTLYIELNELKNRVPEDLNSTDWKQYGLIELQNQEKKYWQLMSVNTNEYDPVQVAAYKNYTAIHKAIESEITVRENEIKSKETEINNCQKVIQSLVIKLEDFLGKDLYRELNAYVKEDTLTDDSFIVTSIMTENEILDMQKALLEHAKKELEKICYPKIETEIDLINFTVNYDYKKFTDQLDLFNIVHIRFEEHDAITDVRLLKLHVNWDDPSDFSATFSNRNSLDESYALLKEIQDQANSTATEIGFASGAWSGAAQTNIDFRNYQNSIFDASKQQIQSSTNQDVVFDKTGLIIRKYIEDQNKFDDCQMWLTNSQLVMTLDNWNTVSLALGYIKVDNDYFYGLNAERICGKMIFSEQLYVTNNSGTYTITDAGFLIKNGSYQIAMKPDTPSEIFSISIDNKKLLYVDTTNKKLKFEGDIESTSGHIANYVISGNSLTSGNVGMSSNTTSGAIAFWAGSGTSTTAPFRVTNTGNLVCSNATINGGSLNINNVFKVSNTGAMTCSNATITGGSLRVGNNFTVTTSGILTAVDANLTGKITATSGKIGGWIIEGDKLKGDHDSGLISGGKIDIGNFYADEDVVEMGDFYVGTDYGRGVFQSYDECTGMSTGDLANNELYMWAGYGHGDGGEEAVFLVNTGQVRVGGNLIVKGRYILDEIDKLQDAIGGGTCDCDCDCDTCDASFECEGPGCWT